MFECNVSSSIIAAAFCSALKSWLPLNSQHQTRIEKDSATSAFLLSKKTQNVLFNHSYSCVTSPLQPLPIHRFKEDALVDLDCDDVEEGGDLSGLLVNKQERFSGKKVFKIENTSDEHETNLFHHGSSEKKLQQKQDGFPVEHTIRIGKSNNIPLMANCILSSSSAVDSFFSSSSLSFMKCLNSQNLIDNDKNLTDTDHSLPDELGKTIILKHSEPGFSGASKSFFLSEYDSKSDSLNSGTISCSFSASLPKSFDEFADSTSLSAVPEFSQLWLKNTLQKLHLPPAPADDMPLGTLSVADLHAEKKKIKQELRNFDKEFSKVFHRDITRDDKEAVRCLYAYYQKLKKYLNKLQQNMSTKRTKTSMNNLDKKLNNSVISKSESVSNFTPCVSVTSSSTVSENSSACPDVNALSKSEHHYFVCNSSSTTNSSFLCSSLVANSSSKKMLELAPLSESISFSSFNESKSNFAFASKASATNSNSHITYQNYPSRYESSEEWIRLQRLKEAKRALRERLVAYQSKFKEANGRPVKLYKDIAPIEREYSQYKKLKEEIIACMEKLGIVNSADRNEAKNKFKEIIHTKHSK